MKKENGYWTEDNTIIELKSTITKFGYFPTQKEVYETQSSLEYAMRLYGGRNKFRKLLGYNLIRKPNNYWNDEIIIDEIKKLVDKEGHLPTKAVLYKIGRGDLIRAIERHGGFPKFRETTEQGWIKKPNGYWSFENTLKELKTITDELGHFPSHNELCIMNRTDLSAAIKNNGGIVKFREKSGISISIYDKYHSESGAYSVRRGIKTEKLIRNILKKWCSIHVLPEPKYNKKLAPHNIIEFVCNIGRKIGIDVTNTKDISGNAVRRKYLKKDYYKHLDELWIIVVSDVFTKQDYRRFNTESPENVRVMQIDDFIKEIDILTDEYTSLINNYKKCTFPTKKEFVRTNLNNGYIPKMIECQIITV